MDPIGIKFSEELLTSQQPKSLSAAHSTFGDKGLNIKTLNSFFAAMLGITS
jgi:hypothetical protein